jgi:hypothetical protein
MLPLDETIKQALKRFVLNLERQLKGHVVSYTGPIEPAAERRFRLLIEDRKRDDPAGTKLVIVLTTPGGSSETVEKLVNVSRHHYQELVFVVPEMAMSAGTIFCMAGDSIFMDYSSALGPIDPQVFNGKDWVPALGYLDKYNEMVEKSRLGTLTQAEFLVMQSQDLAMLSRCEQARNLTITLLKRWLVQYKFANWTTHATDPAKLGQPVTPQEKTDRAEEIARDLANNQKWHSHARYINMATLQKEVRLKIEDLSSDVKLRDAVRGYNELLLDYKSGRGYPLFLHSKTYF